MSLVILLMANLRIHAATLIDEYGSAFSDVVQFGAVTGGVYMAYRIVKSAHNDAITLYKEAAADADARLDSERALWAAERRELLDQINSEQSNEGKRNE